MTALRLTFIFQLLGYGMISVAVVIALLTVRLMSDGQEGLKQATYAMESGKRALAAVHLEDAAKAYVPGSPYPRKALRELSIMARAAEMRGELDNAIALWESVRRSVIATRHIYSPNQDFQQLAERNLVRVRSDAGPLDLAIDLTYRGEDPSVLLSVFIFVGLIVWIVGATLLTLGPKDASGQPIVRNGYAWLLTLVGLCLWVAGTALV